MLQYRFKASVKHFTERLKASLRVCSTPLLELETLAVNATSAWYALHKAK